MSIPERTFEEGPRERAARIVGRRRGRRWKLPRLPRFGRRSRWVLGGLAVVIALVVIASFFVDEPLRRYVEGQMNQHLKGYTAHIDRLSFHPIGASLTLRNLVMIQDAHPDPPVLLIERLDASVQWKALLFGRVVANLRIERPKLYADSAHVEREAKDPTPLEQHGWQQAFEAIYPLKINQVRIVEGQVTYVDDARFEPLRLTRIDLTAENIRNIRSKDRVYPSDVHAEAVVFDRGRLLIDGNADFLAAPHLGVKGVIELTDIALDPFRSLTNRVNVTVQGGTLSARGRVEYAPTIKMVDLEKATIDGVHVEYVHTRKDAGITQKAAVTTDRAARQAAQRQDLILRVEDFRVTRARLGLVNKTATPEFRMFLSDVDLHVRNLSNKLNEGVGRIELRGKFMGSGATRVLANLRPEQKGPDFDVDIAIENTDMTKMNDVLRAYGKFDVVQGHFSFYSEMRVKNGYVNGYVKPLFSDVKAFDPEQDRDKGFAQRLYERVVGGVSKVLKNVPRKEVATKIDISGPLDAPQTGTLQAVWRLVQNAFFRAILPGFDHQVGDSPGRAASK
ncbi:MAG TPA: DUF748 domain-containing protein [Candidatus Acidoferrum sp.]|nr:DUF748 domain-containing protein [Candidatus Acidoferrum sp.]